MDLGTFKPNGLLVDFRSTCAALSIGYQRYGRKSSTDRAAETPHFLIHAKTQGAENNPDSQLQTQRFYPNSITSSHSSATKGLCRQQPVAA